MLTTVDPRVQMSGLIMGFVPAQAIAIAAELGIADLLAREPMTTTQLAESTGSDASALYRVMRYLASLGIFQADENGRFALTPMAELLRTDAGDSMRSMSRIMGRVGPGTVSGLLDGVRTGKNPFEMAFGQHLFEYLPTHPEDAVLFDAAMNGFHGPETDAVLDAYSYDGVSTLADIGCGNGTVLTATLRRYPSLKGVFFDQPDVVERARAAAAQDISSRSQFVSGSFFESVPAGADAYQMRHIIHDWSDELSLQILKNIRRVIPSHGRVLVVETIVPEGNDPSVAKLFDLMMLLFPPNGLERTEREFRNLLRDAGFAVASVTPTASPVSVIDARPV
jgi:O-methyltransferase/methyltransferase family protein